MLRPALPATRSYKQAPLSGFVPLKGQAALPIGTIVDTRKGRMSTESMVDGRGIASGGRSQTAILSAGDGTRTDVGKGTMTVLNRSTDATATVKAGRSYLVKAERFRAKQARG